MSNEDRRDAIFETLNANADKLLAREISEKIEIEKLGDDNGPAVWHIKQCPAWCYPVYQKIDPGTNQLEYAAGIIVAYAHDMFGKPIFYDNETENGTELSLKVRLAMLDQSREKLVLSIGTDVEALMEIFEQVMDARKKIAAQMPTVQQVKEPSLQGSATT